MTNGQEQGGGGKPTDPISAFWADFMSKVGTPVAGAASAVEPEFVKQMRQSFFQAMARHADEFMRSEQFLTAMKQGMDNALAFRQQLDRFLTNTVHGAQQPAREDTDHILLVIRSMEERVLGRLDDLAERVEALESSDDAKPKAKAERASPERRRTTSKARRSGRRS